ncbi:MAG: YdeI/OmpD-associated family protein [Planctomycetes bacterium]|nr:YdeI/OmpD-associated family protein [Planctomycetota bacterium]
MTTANWWVICAKKAETRMKRLKQLIEDSASGRRIRQFLVRKGAK